MDLKDKMTFSFGYVEFEMPIENLILSACQANLVGSLSDDSA